MKKTICLMISFLLSLESINAQKRNFIGTVSDDPKSSVQLQLIARNQSFEANNLKKNDVYDTAVNSPKSAVFSQDGTKYYVNSLEGNTTAVYCTKSNKKLKEIKHIFNFLNNHLIQNNESTVFTYKQSSTHSSPNYFSGKPVESCLSHSGKFLWVTYYRRDWDKNAQFPSALAIIDTHTDKIVRVMPTGPLPKMIACSPDNNYIAVTHWGDNTVGIISINSTDPAKFKYIKHCVVGEQLQLAYDDSVNVDRDNNCGSCLRGTVFTPDSKYLLVAKMGGNGGIAFFKTKDFSNFGTVSGMMGNTRHLAIANDELFLSSNKFGYVQKCSLSDLVSALEKPGKSLNYSKFISTYVGLGARTISVTKDGKYIFAAVNNDKKIVVVRSSDMKIVSSINADPYPVGMALSKNETRLIVTAQGKSGSGGNSVAVYSITYPSNK